MASSSSLSAAAAAPAGSPSGAAPAAAVLFVQDFAERFRGGIQFVGCLLDRSRYRRCRHASLTFSIALFSGSLSSSLSLSLCSTHLFFQHVNLLIRFVAGLGQLELIAGPRPHSLRRPFAFVRSRLRSSRRLR